MNVVSLISGNSSFYMIDFKSPPQGSYCVKVILSFRLKENYDWSVFYCEFKLLLGKTFI